MLLWKYSFVQQFWRIPWYCGDVYLSNYCTLIDSRGNSMNGCLCSDSSSCKPFKFQSSCIHPFTIHTHTSKFEPPRMLIKNRVTKCVYNYIRCYMQPTVLTHNTNPSFLKLKK